MLGNVPFVEKIMLFVLFPEAGKRGCIRDRKRKRSLRQSVEVDLSHLNKHIIILHNQGVRVNVARERSISVGLGAVLHAASQVLRIWKKKTGEGDMHTEN